MEDRLARCFLWTFYALLHDSVEGITNLGCSFSSDQNAIWPVIHKKTEASAAIHTLIMPWQVASGSPTRLVSLMDIIWSPTLSFPERAAGPVFSILARMTVGRMEPQPDSTITTPRLSPFCFSTYNWNVHHILFWEY